MRRPANARRLLPAAAVATLWCGTGAVLAVSLSGRVRDWSVMTDELQYVKLALAVAETGSPLPSIHGLPVSAANQLYPLLLAPVYGPLSSPDAFRVAHVLGAFVMASAAVPAYLVARGLVERTWALAAALLTVVVPWMVLTGFLMSEVLAYPAFLWAVLALHRAVAAPSPRHDALAMAALGAAVLARTQLAVLALVLPLAIVWLELARPPAPDAGTGLLRRLRAGGRRALRAHPVLVALYGAGAAAAAVAWLAGSGHTLFGAYSVAVEGHVLPAGVWAASARHLAVVGIGCGLVPLVLGGGWILATLVRPTSRDRHAFAVLSLLAIAMLAIESASFDLRFGGPDVVRDRYLFYVVPLLLVASAAGLTEAHRGRVAVGSAVVAALFGATALGLAFPTFEGLSVDSPVSILNETLSEQSGSLSTATFVALAGILLGVVVALAVAVAPRLPLALVVFIALLAFSVLTLRAEVDRVVSGTALSGRPLAGPPGLVLDWVDSVVPAGESAALVPFPVSTDWGASAIRWWDVEFWNKRVTRSYDAPDGNFTYTPFPDGRLALDPETGAVAGTADAPAYVVVAPGDPRFGLAGRVHAKNLGLRVIAAERPYRVLWSTRGLQTDGWTTPGVPASIRVYPRPGSPPRVARVRIALRAPESTEARYRLSTPSGERTGDVPAGATAEEVVTLCVAPRSPADVTLTSSTAARIDGAPLSPEIAAARLVGVGVGGVSVASTGGSCPAA